MRPFRVEAPQGVLVPVEELRQQVNLDTDEQDGRLTSAERAAVARLDGYTGRLGRCILRQKWALPLIGNPEVVHLPFPDCFDFKIERLDSGNWTEIEGVALQYFEDQVSLSDMPDDWTNLHLTCQAGWETAADVPEDIKQAVCLLVAHLVFYDPKTWDGLVAGQLPQNVESMISGYASVFA
jgi:hypothetical protein